MYHCLRLIAGLNGMGCNSYILPSRKRIIADMNALIFQPSHCRYFEESVIAWVLFHWKAQGRQHFWLTSVQINFKLKRKSSIAWIYRK
jgi:hypothetical protein